MPVSYGRDATLAFAKETTYNEAWGSPTLVGLYVDKVDFVPNIDILREAHISARPELSISDVAQGIQNYTLKVDGRVPKEAFGFLLLSLFGKVTTPAPSGGFYTHTFVPSTTTPASLKIEYRQPLNSVQSRWQLRGAKVKTLEIIANQNDFIKYSIDFIGGAFAQADSIGSAPTVPVPASGDVFYNWNHSPTLSIGTVTAGITSLSFTFESVLADDVTDSYEVTTSGSETQRVRLERASTEEAFKIKAVIKRIWQAPYEYADWTGFVTTGISYSLTDSTYNLTLYSDHMKILKNILTPKGLGLVEETTEFEGFTSGTAADNTVIYKDKQAEPTTQGT